VKTSFAERALGHLAKALINPRLEKGVHRLLGGKLEEADEAVWKRLKIAQTEFRILQRMDPEVGDHAVSLRAEGLSGEEVLKRLHMDPSLAPLLVASDDQLESLMGELLAGGLEEREKDFKE